MTNLTQNSPKTRITCATVAAMISAILLSSVVLGMTDQAAPRVDHLAVLAHNQMASAAEE